MLGRAPITMTLAHQSCTFLMLFLTNHFCPNPVHVNLRLLSVRQLLHFLWIIFILSFVEVLNLISSNVALMAIVSYFVFDERYPPSAILAIMAMIVSSAIASIGDFSRSFLGIALTLLSTIVANVRNTLADAFVKGRPIKLPSWMKHHRRRRPSRPHDDDFAAWMPSLTARFPAAGSAAPSTQGLEGLTSSRAVLMGRLPSPADSPLLVSSLPPLALRSTDPTVNPFLDVRLVAYLKAGVSALMAAALIVAMGEHRFLRTMRVRDPSALCAFLVAGSLVAAVSNTTNLYVIKQTSAVYMQVMTVAKHLFATLVGYMIFGGKLTEWFWVGLFCVLASVAWFNYAIFKKREKSSRPDSASMHARPYNALSAVSPTAKTTTTSPAADVNAAATAVSDASRSLPGSSLFPQSAVSAAAEPGAASPSARVGLGTFAMEPALSTGGTNSSQPALTTSTPRPDPGCPAPPLGLDEPPTAPPPPLVHPVATYPHPTYGLTPRLSTAVAALPPPPSSSASSSSSSVSIPTSSPAATTAAASSPADALLLATPGDAGTPPPVLVGGGPDPIALVAHQFAAPNNASPQSIAAALASRVGSPRAGSTAAAASAAEAGVPATPGVGMRTSTGGAERDYADELVSVSTTESPPLESGAMTPPWVVWVEYSGVVVMLAMFLTVVVGLPWHTAPAPVGDIQ